MSPSPPSILVSQYNNPRYPGPPPPRHPSNTSSAAPMAIPRVQHTAPPPLPPPTYIPDISVGNDPGWQWGNDPQRADFGRQAPVKPGSSLLGGATPSMGLEKEYEGGIHNNDHLSRRHSSMSIGAMTRTYSITEDGLAPGDENNNGTSLSNYRLQGERQLGHRTLAESSQSYDKHLLSRIGGPNTAKRQSLSQASSLQDNAQSESERRNGSLKPLSVPERRHRSLDSSTGPKWPSSGTLSPGFPGFMHDQSAPTTRHNSIQFDDSASHRGSYDGSTYAHEELSGDGQMGNLNLHDRSPGSDSLRAGSKRRASSPPRDYYGHEDRSSVSSASGQSENLYHRRSMQHLPARGSPVSRFNHAHPSASPTSSHQPRHGSQGSSLGLASLPSSATSYASGRLSPHTMSPAVDSDLRFGAPYGPGVMAMSNHSRTYSESTQNGRKVSTDSVMHSRHSSLSNTQGVYVCECCPKKPRRFETEEYLRLHEAEKQYTCAYCPNRFKNKNEAERHQNSLHLRRHSWSCAVLSGVESAFLTAASDGSTDACGYCGDQFPNPPQWDIRASHLNHVHKFGECNQAKKFFRADHFRQHLKHSHAGSSGKWTNMLENACMQDEPLPEKRVVPPPSGSLPGGQAPPTLIMTPSGPGGMNH